VCFPACKRKGDLPGRIVSVSCPVGLACLNYLVDLQVDTRIETGCLDRRTLLALGFILPLAAEGQHFSVAATVDTISKVTDQFAYSYGTGLSFNTSVVRNKQNRQGSG
jgi:hypothetical protein